ncbi:hypothetical protein, partial [Burkholderia multivorans]
MQRRAVACAPICRLSAVCRCPTDNVAGFRSQEVGIKPLRPSGGVEVYPKSRGSNLNGSLLITFT